jgi:hypothetical protein
MAEVARVTPSGWEQADDTLTVSRVTPTGWTQIESEEPPPEPELTPIVMTWTL